MVVQRVEGVREAEFSWREERGVVTYDTTRTSIHAVLDELHRQTDYQARVAGDG